MRIATLIGVTVVIVVIAVWVGVAQLTNKGASNHESSKSVNVVLNDLGKVRGKRVAVSGSVKTSLAPYAVLLGSSDATQTGLLVVAKGKLPQGVRTTTQVVADGIAKTFSLTDFRKAHPGLSGVEIDRSPLRSLVGKPAIVSATVSVQR